MVLGDRDLLVTLAIFTTVVNGESSRSGTKIPVAKYHQYILTFLLLKKVRATDDVIDGTWRQRFIGDSSPFLPL